MRDIIPIRDYLKRGIVVNKFRELIEAPARIIRTANPDIVRRLKKHKPPPTKPSLKLVKPLLPKGPGLQFERDGQRLEYIFKHGGRWVIDTNHAAQRMGERNSYSNKEIEGFFRRMINKYLSMGPEYTNLNNPEFLFFSKSMNQGMIIAYRKDFKKIDSKKHFVVVTFFPKGSKRVKRGTDIIMIESYDYGAGPIFSDEFVEYMSQLRCQYGTSYECFFDGKQTYIPECIQIENIKFDIIFCEGKLFQISDFEVIEID